jgi:4-hydroxyphenylpyruvate dioxygenase
MTAAMTLLDFDAITFYVGNAKQAAFFYHHMLGFSIVAYQGPETGVKETVTYVLRQNNITLKLVSGLTSTHDVSRHVALHGDGIKDISFLVPNLADALEWVKSRGATIEGLNQVRVYNETTHTLVEKRLIDDLPASYRPMSIAGKDIGLQRVDHAVANVPVGQMDEWASYYEHVFGLYVFRVFDSRDISTQYSALVSKVMANSSGSIKLPINEPADGLKRSQIQEYLDFYQGSGIQHLALHSQDLIETVSALRSRHFPFITVPDSYYQTILERVSPIQEDLESLRRLGILIDRESDGYLLQLFTQPLQDRPTFFFEFIQRQGASGFGKGNFKALFEAIEREQAQRGNL